MTDNKGQASGTRHLRIRNLETLRSCRLCIICAKSKEAVTVRDQLRARTKIESRLVEDIASGHDFYLGLLPTKQGFVPYYITSTTRQGIQTFATQTAALFSVLKPEFAIHVGVCAAITGQNIELEDVIFGERALNYEEGKWHVVEGRPVFMADINILGTKSDIMDGFLAERGRPIWKHGDYVSGCAVRMDAEHIFDRVRKAALEMEASAFLQVCDYMAVQALGVVKGVSDMGDAYKGVGNDKHYDSALRNAAKATEEFLKWKLDDMPLEPLEIDREPGSYLVQEYFEKFVRQVVTKAYSADLEIYIGNDLLKMRGFRIILPPKKDVRNYKNLETIFKSKRLLEVNLAGGNRSTTVWTKGPYFVDFPTTLTQLGKYIDMEEQVKHFKRTLKVKIEELNELNDDGFTQVISWEQFKGLCEEIDCPTAPSSNATSHG